MLAMELSGMKDRKYQIGDALTGELIVRARRRTRVVGITARLDYVIEGESVTQTVHLTEFPVVEAEYVAKPDSPRRFAFSAPKTFNRPTYASPKVRCYWRLRFAVVEDGGKRGVIDRLLGGEDAARRPSDFEVAVENGRGSYRTESRLLPVPATSKSAWFVALGAVILHSILVPFYVTTQPIYLLAGGWLVILLITLFYQSVYLSVFQATPMELIAGRDGALRLRILNRGNRMLEKASVGYRVREHYLITGPNGEQGKRSRVAYNFAEYARSVVNYREQFYELTLPWPAESIPTFGAADAFGYRWEVYLTKPNPITGLRSEISWPIKVRWESLEMPGANE